MEKQKEVVLVAVLTLKGEEIKTFPPVLREYASHLAVIKGNSEKYNEIKRNDAVK